MTCVPLFCQCVFVSLCLYVPVFLSLSFCLWPHVFVCLCLSLCCCVWGRLSAMESPDRAPIAAFICRPLLMSLLHPHYTAPNRPQITTKKRKLVSGCFLSRKHLSTQVHFVYWPVCSPSKFDNQTPLSGPCFLQVHAWGLQPAAAVNYLIRNWLLRRTSPPGSCGCTAQPRFNQ